VLKSFLLPWTQEFDVLMHLGDKTNPMAEMDLIEDCDPWELMLGTRAHNRCFTLGVDQQGQLGQGVLSRHGIEKNAAIVRCRTILMISF